MVTHHTLSVEHPRLVADRIVRYARIVGTDCGFQQGARIERVHPQIMWAKLESLAEGARFASKELWR